MNDPNVVKVETARHGEAFDYYYNLGENRKHSLVASRFNVTEMTVARWSASFNWQQRIAERDAKNNARIQQKTDNRIVNTKLDYREDIRKALQPVKASINTAIKVVDGEATIIPKVTTPRDLFYTVSAYEKLAKLDLVLMGENIDEGIAKPGASINIVLDTMSDDDRTEYFDAAIRLRAFRSKAGAAQGAAP